MGTVLYRRLALALALAALPAAPGCKARTTTDKAPEGDTRASAPNLVDSIREAAERPKRANRLKAIALAYLNCNDAAGKGPANVNELGKYLPDDPDSLAAVKSGEIVVLWNARIPASFPSGLSNTVLAYEKDVPARGGQVAMGDASVRTMTAQEFGAAARPTIK